MTTANDSSCRADVIPVPLYHGTSTPFLDSILEHGLGARDVIADWKVLAFARALAPLVSAHCEPRDDLAMKAAGFRWMAEQRNEGANFQHGHAYLSPSIDTAVRYAASMRYGSELLTYSLDMLQVLLKLEVAGIRDELYRQFPEVFAKLDLSPAPILIKIENVPVSAVLSERGGNPAANIELIQRHREDRTLASALFQQVNFRLVMPQEIAEVSLINVQEFDPIAPKYSLYALRV